MNDDDDVNTVVDFLFCFDHVMKKGPSEEELFQREGDDICLERGRTRRRREEEGQQWEKRLQENWENCLVSQRAFVCVIIIKVYSIFRDGGRRGRS